MSSSTKKKQGVKRKAGTVESLDVDATLSATTTVSRQMLLRIVHIDVNQGESTLILYGCKEKTDYAALVDGGRAKYSHHIINTLLAYKIKRLDLMVVTHFDTDHLEGLTALLEDGLLKEHGIVAENIYDRGGGQINDEKPLKFKNAVVKETGFAPKVMKPGLLFNSGNFSIQCLFVENKQCARTEENDAGVILQVQFGEFSYFTAGDQGHLNEYRHAVASAAFKCGHHGSKNSTGPKLLKKLKASVAVISAGATYGHPDHEVLKNLNGSKSIQHIYLTNCAYNRPQVNHDYMEQEQSLMGDYLRAIKENLPGRKEFSALKEGLSQARAHLRKNKYEKYCNEIINCNGKQPEGGSQKLEWRKALLSASQAAEIYLNECVERSTVKAVVAGCDRFLGNIELCTTASIFRVSYMGAWGVASFANYPVANGEQPSPEFWGPPVKAIARVHPRPESFASITSRKGKEREEVEASPEQVAADWNLIKEDADDKKNMDRMKKRRTAMTCDKCGTPFEPKEFPVFKGGCRFHEACLTD